MKKTKVIIPALGILLLSTAASVTGTVAWFTANSTVTANGMNFQAKVEKGIVIANETHAAASDWKASVAASHSGLDSENKNVTFFTTSTADLATWYHANSEENDNGQVVADGGYQTLSPSVGTDGIAKATIHDNPENIYLLNKFYIQSSSASAITNQKIYVSALTITPSGSNLLNPSLRVGVKYNTNVTIFAPVSGASTTYDVAGTTSVTAKYTYGASASVVTGADALSIPAYNEAGASALEFSVFVYFEGEDANHKSSNIGESDTLDNFKVEIKFANVAA